MRKFLKNLTQILLVAISLTGCGSGVCPLRTSASICLNSGSSIFGILDTSFGGTGIITTAMGATSDVIYTLAIQTDGKIVAAGAASNGANNDFAIARYNTDGSLDTTFNTTGKVITSLTGGNDAANSVVIQTDGKIVAAGIANNDFGLARYNTDGSLDTTFNTTGMVTTAFAASDSASSLALQPDGKIVVAGYASPASQVFAIARYNTDGSLDTNFNITGRVTTAPTGASDWAYSVLLQPDGKIVAAGGGSSDVAVIRYNTDGSLDTNFNTTGYVTTPIGTNNDQAASVVLQPDGKIVTGGYSYNGVNDDFAVIRYNSNGSLDTTFNGTGKVTTPVGTTDTGLSIALQSDGKIILGGAANLTNYDFAVVRYNTNGSLDTTFNYTGKITTSIGASTDYGRAVFIQPNGRVILAGSAFIGTSLFALVRYR